MGKSGFGSSCLPVRSARTIPSGTWSGPVKAGDTTSPSITIADKTVSYTHTTSLAVMERLKVRTAFAFDPHFRQYGFQVYGLKP